MPNMTHVEGTNSKARLHIIHALRLWQFPAYAILKVCVNFLRLQYSLVAVAAVQKTPSWQVRSLAAWALLRVP